MSFYLKDYQGNALAITDDAVASDWRLGLVRGVARFMRYSILPSDSTGSYGITVEGSNRAHLEISREDSCRVTEIYDIQETSEKDYNFDTFGGSEYEVILLSCKATCACGRLEKYEMSMTVRPDELIYSITNSDQD